MAPGIKKTKTRRGNLQRFIAKPRICPFCTEKVKVIDYKDVSKLSRYISDGGRIVTRRRSSACAKHQRHLALAIKRARHLALLPYTTTHIQKTGYSSIREDKVT